MAQLHSIYTADSTKIGKTIAMLLAGNLLGPDWSRYAVHHYAVKNNAFEGVSYIQLQSRHATKFESSRVHLKVVEKGGVNQFHMALGISLDVGDEQIWTSHCSWDKLEFAFELDRIWTWLRLCGKDGVCADESELLHPDNRI